MGHRALIACERPDSTYNLHYSHWGGLNLRLRGAITEETPFGSETPDERLQMIHSQLCDVTSDSDISDVLDGRETPSPDVDIDPWDIQLSLEEIITEHLDYLHHEAFYLVDSDLKVTAYRTHWFGLQYDCTQVGESPTLGHGALRTIRWYDGEPVGDGFAQGEFRALKAITGELLDDGVFTHETAIEYLAEKLATWVDDQRDLIIRTPQSQ